MNLEEIQDLRDDILNQAYQMDDTVDSRLPTGLQSELNSLRNKASWKNIAVGYSFSNTDDAVVEIKVPRNTKKTADVALKIKEQLQKKCKVNITRIDEPQIASGLDLVNFKKPVNLKRDELVLGHSVGSEYQTGTLGGFAIDDEENIHIIGCSHVLGIHPGENRVASEGQPIYHPGPADNKPDTQNHAANLSHCTILSEQWLIDADTAFAELKEGIKYSGNIVPRLNSPFDGREICGLLPDHLQNQVEMVYLIGKESGFKRGLVTGWGIKQFPVAVSRKSNQNPLRLKFEDVIEVEPVSEHCFSTNGDSGSLVFCEVDKTLYAVGIVFSGGKVKKGTKYLPTSYICPLKKSLEKFDLQWLSENDE